MANYRLTPAAKRDLDDIWNYTEERWGRSQAPVYIGLLRSAIERCCDRHYPARPIDHIKPGYFRANAGSHAIIYRWDGDMLVVVRVLHGRRDFKQHLE
ncbi:MAG: type II toxin-antitoxin system RelE/ParE family toxin [Alphaproteobacteria bacterium]|nr:MAG: type II toxin-antitoxin system RelE/ParE family toxin [Alphaproteobacteria bacterium]